MFLFIDRGTIAEKKAFAQSPPTYHELSISIVAFGGFYSFEPAEISKQKSKAGKGTIAFCPKLPQPTVPYGPL